MATQTQTTSTTFGVQTNQWLSAAAGGVLGSVLFGLIMQFVMTAPLLEIVIPTMYGVEAPALAAGWAIHVFHGVFLALAYVALVQLGPLDEPARRINGAIGLGVAYGVLTTAVLAVLVMPLWLSAVGFPMAPPFPNLAFPATVVSTIGHIVYAVPVALGYALASR